MAQRATSSAQIVMPPPTGAAAPTGGLRSGAAALEPPPCLVPLRSGPGTFLMPLPSAAGQARRRRLSLLCGTLFAAVPHRIDAPIAGVATHDEPTPGLTCGHEMTLNNFIGALAWGGRGRRRLSRPRARTRAERSHTPARADEIVNPIYSVRFRNLLPAP